MYAATLQAFEKMQTRIITIERNEVINQTEATLVAERSKAESSKQKQVQGRK